MCPFFYNKVVLEETDTVGMGKSWLELYKRRKPWSTPRFRFGMWTMHGGVITAVYRTIDYVPRKIFSWLVEEVTEARHTGHVEKEKALLADIFKLLGNSATEIHQSVGVA